jgi:hypothetical protein
MPVILALGRVRQENQEFKASLGCMARPCLKEKKERRKEEREVREEGKGERKGGK